jgi:predicted O-methyltransferase YrrM
MKNWIFLGLTTLCSVLNGYNQDWEQNKKEVLLYQEEQYILGWCSREKAEKLMDLIFDTHPKICVEIGVFGGSSIYPTASALKYLKNGIVYAIDPWSKEECLKGYAPGDPNYGWWDMLDQEKIYEGFQAMLNRFDLASFCKTLRMTSEQAVLQFQDETIDILHIDGNHTEQVALADARMFLPKVKKGGYIWFDDANWSTTNKAVQYLIENCSLDEARSTSACFLFKKS